MTIRSKTLYLALHGTIFKVFPDNSVIHNNDKISSAFITVLRKQRNCVIPGAKEVSKVLKIIYNDGSTYTVNLERLVLLRTMKVTAEKSDDI